MSTAASTRMASILKSTATTLSAAQDRSSRRKNSTMAMQTIAMKIIPIIRSGVAETYSHERSDCVCGRERRFGSRVPVDYWELGA
jgi:hypothetical protein